jgi:DNA-binding transcriptional regulator YdaS (Cro superfamily)
MTPAQLRTHCDSLGGVKQLASLLDWDPRTVRNKLAGRSVISKSDALAVERLIELAGLTATRGP